MIELLRKNITQGILVHSAKGSSWDDHKYVKKVNGVYYYPDDYKGGRHAGDNKKEPISKDERYNKDDEDIANAEEAWESTVYGDIDKIMKDNPILTDPVALAKIAFDNNLKGKLSDAEISRMIEKVEQHYSKSSDKKGADKNVGGNSKSTKNIQTDKTDNKNVQKAAEAAQKIAEAAKKKKQLKHSDMIHGIILERRR